HGAGRDDDVDAGAAGAGERFARGVDVFLSGAAERGYGRAVNRFRDRLHAFEISGRRDSEARLDHVDSESLQLTRDLGFLVRTQRDARGLLPVTQSRVENRDT